MISLLFAMATRVSLFKHLITGGLQCLGCKVMTYKSEQRASVRYVYEGKDVSCGCLVVLASHYATKFYPSWLM